MFSLRNIAASFFLLVPIISFACFNFGVLAGPRIDSILFLNNQKSKISVKAIDSITQIADKIIEKIPPPVFRTLVEVSGKDEKTRKNVERYGFISKFGEDTVQNILRRIFIDINHTETCMIDYYNLKTKRLMAVIVTDRTMEIMTTYYLHNNEIIQIKYQYLNELKWPGDSLRRDICCYLQKDNLVAVKYRGKDTVKEIKIQASEVVI